MKAAIVNLELWYLYEEEQNYIDILDKTYELAVKEIEQCSQNNQLEAVIGLLLCDGFLYKNNESFYQLLAKFQNYCEQKGIKDFILIIGIVEEYQQELNQRNLKWQIKKWDFSVNGLYQSYKDRLEIIPSWNDNSDKFLFLGGQPARTNRINLLSKFYDAKLLDNGIWSFFKPISSKDKAWCRNALAHYTDEQYDFFIAHCERNVDDLYVNANHYATMSGKQWLDSNMLDNEFLNDPNFIDPTIFSNSSISILSEGHVHPPGNDYRFLTEKTWRAVLNNHPFILACVPQRMDFIKSKGLRTFENYMAIPNYAYTKDYDMRLSQVVDNTVYFLHNYRLHLESIQEDIYFNQQRFFDIVKDNHNLISSLQDQYQIPDNIIEYWFRQKSFTHLFRIPNE